MSDTTIVSVTEEIHVLEDKAAAIAVLENCVINLNAAGGGGGTGALITLAYSPTGIYNLPDIPAIPNRLQLFVNGAKQRYGVDYTIVNTVLTWTSANLTLTNADTIEVYV